jgi:hypothetical protein
MTLQYILQMKDFNTLTLSDAPFTTPPLLVMHANIKLGCNKLTATNTLAYDITVLITINYHCMMKECL